MSVKINIESDNVAVSAAIAAIIDDALAKHGFNNVKGKCVMVYQTAELKLPGLPIANFSKRNLIKTLIDPEEGDRPKLYDTVLLDGKHAFGYPEMFDWLCKAHPQVQSQPVLINTGVEQPTSYATEVQGFLEGKS